MRKFTKAMASLLSVTMLAAMVPAVPAMADEPVILKWIQIGSEPNNHDAAIEAMNEYSIEKIGVGVEITYLDWGVWSDKVTAMVNSGEYFDIMFTNGDKYSAGISLGAFEDITDLLEEVPDLVDFIPEKVWEGTKVNGRIYSVPTYKDSSQTQYWVWDKEVAEMFDVDVENVHTVEEIDPYLYEIQEAINNGEITGTNYAFTTASDGINGFLMNYESPLAPIGVRFDDEDCKVVNVFEQDDIMTVFKYLHKWYNDNLINPDAATTDQGPSWVILSSGQGFPGAEVTWSTGRGKDVLIEPWGGPLYSTGTILGSVNVISSASHYKTEALKYLELVNLDPEMRNMLAYGVEGEDWMDNGDGTITRSEDCYSPAAYSQATFFTMFPVAPNKANQWTRVEEWNEGAVSSVLLGFSFDRSEVENEMANCSLILERYKKELYTGTSDPEEIVPILYEELEKAGLEEIRDEYQRQIDEWKAAKED